MTRNIKTIWSIAAVAAGGMTIGAAHADILHDALHVDLNDRFPHSGSPISSSTIGGLNLIGESFDVQSADDFVLTEASTITNLTVDIATFTNMGASSLPPSVMVEFFVDAGGVPAGAATATSNIASSDFTSVTQFDAGGWPSDDGSQPPGFRIGLDLSADGIVLGAGTWWVSVVGIGDDNFYSMAAADRDDHQTGALVHVRGGGMAHGNGFSDAGFGFNWIPSTFDQDSVGDLALRIEGGPPVTPCAADLNTDGVVDVFDLLAYLDLWFIADPGAELTGDDPASIDVFDLLAYLDSWFAGC